MDYQSSYIYIIFQCNFRDFRAVRGLKDDNLEQQGVRILCTALYTNGEQEGIETSREGGLKHLRDWTGWRKHSV